MPGQKLSCQAIRGVYAVLATDTRIELHSLIDQDCNSLQLEDAADQYLGYDESKVLQCQPIR